MFDRTLIIQQKLIEEPSPLKHSYCDAKFSENQLLNSVPIF